MQRVTTNGMSAGYAVAKLSRLIQSRYGLVVKSARIESNVAPVRGRWWLSHLSAVRLVMQNSPRALDSKSSSNCFLKATAIINLRRFRLGIEECPELPATGVKS